MKSSRLFLLLAFASFVVLSKAQVDRTKEEKAVGEDVVDATVTYVQNIFGNDYNFMKRVAYVASGFGESPETFRPNFYGGIWQLGQTNFDSTLNATNLANLTAAISVNHNVTWNTTTWNDLLKPLHSGLATRLYLASLNVTIPTGLAQQADLWATRLNRNDSLNATHFVDLVEKWENETLIPCNAKMDLIVVMDGSSSIEASDFLRVKNFTAELFGTYSLDNVRMGLIQYSTNYRIEFELANNFNNITQVQERTLLVQQIGTRTNTNLGILQAIAMFNRTAERPGVPKVMVLFTDGESNEGGWGNGGVPNITDAYNANIESFAVGVGNYKESELNEIAYNDPSRVFPLADFEALVNFFRTLNKETCEAPQVPEYNATVADQLVQNEKRYFKFTALPEEGFTFSLGVAVGDVEGYWSYGDFTNKPSSSLHNGQISSARSTYIPNPWGNSSTVLPRAAADVKAVYVSLKGTQDRSVFVITTENGNTVPVAETTTDPSTSTEMVTDTTEGGASSHASVSALVILAATFIFTFTL